jgi:hypothetical protein
LKAQSTCSIILRLNRHILLRRTPRIPVKPARVWTGEGQPHANWSVLISGKIAAVGPADKMNIPPAPSVSACRMPP